MRFLCKFYIVTYYFFIVTAPAHDPNDYEIGIRHNLPLINILTDDGKMNKSCGKFAGLKRFDARKQVAEELEKLGLLHETTDNPMVVPMCRLVFYILCSL